MILLFASYSLVRLDYITSTVNAVIIRIRLLGPRGFDPRSLGAESRLPLMHTWTYQTCEGPSPGGPSHVKLNIKTKS